MQAAKLVVTDRVLTGRQAVPRALSTKYSPPVTAEAERARKASLPAVSRATSTCLVSP